MGDYGKTIADLEHSLQLADNSIESLNGIAWFQATCPDAKYRDGKKAVENARKACDINQGKDWRTLDTLAAAYAESGDFAAAITAENKALGLVEKLPANDANSKTLDKVRARIKLYEAKKPYRDEPTK
jgi:tetratricopeptide (TPR) repeat protein